MAGINDGKSVNAAESNAVWLAKNGDDSTVGKLGLLNADTASGTAITNAQQEHNSIAAFVGKAVNAAKDVLPTWISNVVGVSSDTLFERISAITEKFIGATGHAHTGADGEGAQIDLLSLISDPSYVGMVPTVASDGSIEMGMGGGGGQGGVNFITLDSSLSPANIVNSDFESSIGGWAVYADAAGSLPVDMTGGTPSGNLTIARTTTSTEFLNGVASLKVTKAAANVQGEGLSVGGYIPSEFCGTRCKIVIPFRVLSGSLVQGDVIAAAYDVTNAVLFQASNVDMIGSYGFITGYVDTPISTTAIQIRMGLHFASTSTTAVTFVIDDVKFEKLDLISASVTTAWQDFVPLTDNFGTVTDNKSKYRMNNGNLEIDYDFKVGTVGSGPPVIYFPPGFETTSDYTAAHPCGIFNFYNGATIYPSPLCDPSVNYFYIGVNYGSANPFTAVGNASDYFTSNSSRIAATISVRVKNVASATLTNLSTRTLSQILATGTRVTGRAPNKLGEYRALYRASSSSATLSDVSSMGTAISAADGIRIYGNVPWNSSGTNSQPSVIQFYLGTGINYDINWWASTGKTGTLTTDLCHNRGNYTQGAGVSYIPSTGILTVNAALVGDSGCLSRDLGTPIDTGAAGNVSNVGNGYFDVTFSDAGQALAMVAPRIAILSDVKSSGTNGGAFASGTWVKRDLNTKKDPSGIILNLSSSQFTLDAGTYLFESRAPASYVNSHVSRLYNVTDSVLQVNGSASASGATASVLTMTDSVISDLFTLTGPKIFELQHICSTANLTSGLGAATAGATQEIYSTVKITKIQ